ncbi:MAG: DUF2828 family protein [bacterium]
MFEKKLESINKVVAGDSRKTITSNAFINAAMKDNAKTLSGNGALKYSTTGNPFVDQFTDMGSYRKPRKYEDIVRDCELLWAEDEKLSVLFIYYIRTITRKVQLFNGYTTKEPQKGGQLKHEAIMRMIWLYHKNNDIFWNNIGLFISVGSWKDIFTMLQYDLMYHDWDGRVLNWDRFKNLILNGLHDEQTCNLVKKYLPTIKSRTKTSTVASQANNMIGKWIASFLFGNKQSEQATYKMYRKLKGSGTAHEWQKLISQGKHDLIDFNTIHGRALSLLVKGKYLKNQGLEEKYAEWVKNPDQKLKFTGFVHELFSTLPRNHSSLPQHEADTINKQFNTLVEKGGKKPRTKLIVVRDTSHSMSSPATGTKMSCYDLGKALALYFSEFLTGTFADAWIEFNSDAKLHKWKGKTPIEKWYNDHSKYLGSTNFLSVVNLFARLHKEGVPESDFPTGILCISDSEFNPSSLGITNVEEAKLILKTGGFSDEYVNNFVIVLWNLQNFYYGFNSGKKFETHGDTPNVFYFSGYEPSTISFLDDKIKTPKELFENAMNQEILNMIRF